MSNMNFHRHLLGLRIITLATAAVAGMPAWADPEVEGIDLVSAVRVDRTRFDYTYSLRVRGDARSYLDGTFTVSSIVNGTAVVKPLVAVGRIDAGEFLRTTDTFTIRQDRQVLFDKSNLRLTFNGQLLPASDSSRSGVPAVAGVELLEVRPIPGHSARTTAIQGPPTAGGSIGVRATLIGEIASATASMLSLDGALLASSSLIPFGAKGAHHGRFVVPASPFVLAIKVTGLNGSSVQWESKSFTPAPLTVRLMPESAVVRFSKPMQIQVEVISGGVNGDYNFSFRQLPPGFRVSNMNWTQFIHPGRSVLSVQITPPISGDPFSFHTLSLVVSPKSNPAVEHVSNLRLFLE